jgi:hypothetical protein
MTLGIAALVPHWTMESHVAVHLDDRSAWRDIRSDRPATNADIRGCLAALDALLLRGSFYAGAERTFLKNVTLAAPHSGTSAAHSSAVNTNASIQPSGDSSSRDNIVLQVAAMFLSSRVLILTPVCSSCWSRSPLLSFACSCSKQQKQCPRLRYTCFAAASVAYSIFAFVSSRLPVPSCSCNSVPSPLISFKCKASLWTSPMLVRRFVFSLVSAIDDFSFIITRVVRC